MTGVWVDTDFGFDDLWALLLLRHLNCQVDGLSLTAGNAPLNQVAQNAAAAAVAYQLDWPMWKGAEVPLSRPLETAERILGPTGMCSRGLRLSDGRGKAIPCGAVAAMCDWLCSSPGEAREILAVGPLTNIAQLILAHPEQKHQITRLVWMGGSAGPGNHTAKAEFNAVADAESLSLVVQSGIPLDIIDLTFCRRHVFGEADMPATDNLTRDLLGGYLDIGINRGRSGMAIYDPLAAMAVAKPDCIRFARCEVRVSTKADETYGATEFVRNELSPVRLATEANLDLSKYCLKALEGELAHGGG